MENTITSMDTHEHGSPDHLELREVEMPTAEDDLVLVMVHAAEHCGELCDQTGLARQSS